MEINDYFDSALAIELVHQCTIAAFMYMIHITYTEAAQEAYVNLGEALFRILQDSYHTCRAVSNAQDIIERIMNLLPPDRPHLILYPEIAHLHFCIRYSREILTNLGYIRYDIGEIYGMYLNMNGGASFSQVNSLLNSMNGLNNHIVTVVRNIHDLNGAGRFVFGNAQSDSLDIINAPLGTTRDWAVTIGQAFVVLNIFIQIYRNL